MSGHSLLVIGGARSGKSHYALGRAEETGLKPLFVATAQAFDDEMRDRIARHHEERGAGWDTIEAPIDIAGTIAAHSEPGIVILVDCLTLWATNLILGDHDIRVATGALIAAISAAPGPVILVANEIGLSIVPDNALSRRFRDEAGFINQRVAAEVAEVQLIVAGLPLRLK